MARPIGSRSSPTRRRDEIAEDFVEVLHIAKDARRAVVDHANYQLRAIGAIVALITGADSLFREEREEELNERASRRDESREASRGERLRAL